VNVRFTKGLIDPDTKRPMDRGILADLEVFDNKVAPEVLTDMKNGKKGEVSIGFFFDYDATAGTVDDEDDQSLMGTEYDYVQRNITINHVAFGIDSGRCPMPYCGIGADGTIREFTGDPFGEYESIPDCVSKNQDKDDPGAYCAAIKKKIEDQQKDFKPTDDYNLSMKQTVEEAKVYLRDVLGKLDAIDFLEPGKDDLVEEEYQGNASNITESERAKKFHNISDDDWLALTDEEKTGYIGKLPPVKPKEGETNKDEDGQEESEGGSADDDSSTEDNTDLENDCPECDYDEEEVKRLAADLSLEDIDKKLTSLKATREGLRDQIRKLDEKLYSEPDSEKKRKSALRKQMGELWDKIDDLYDEIHAYTQAKTIKITQAALADEVVDDKKEEKKTLNPDELLEKHRLVKKDKDYPQY
jgi:hypothetical protein